MLIPPGARIGPYEILSALGAGGMGEVYRARDTKLGRDVAIKSLPAAFLHEPERVARLQREAQLLASLNHPHIAAIYGFEETDGAHLLILELVDGQTLADLLRRGPLALGEVLTIARQVAEALEAAHEKGIIHRDLKPANIALTRDGTVKILDFGLAKAVDPSDSDSVSMSPTLSLAATRAGVILGTAAYMSPEQARGRLTDKRTDVWAFGCVLFEMLSGKRAFEGEDVTDVIASVVRAEPDWSALPANLPDHLRLLIKRCLEKDRRARISDIGVARFLLEHGAQVSPAAGETHARGAGRRRVLVWSTLALAAGIALTAGGVWLSSRGPEPAPRDVISFSITPSGRPLITQGNDRDIAISPDGRFIAYVLGPLGQNDLVLRKVSELGTKSLATGTSVRAPFFSADNQWVGYFASDGLRKVSIDGGPSTLVCGTVSAPRGASWGPDDTIFFSTSDPASGLLSVSANGGEPTILTTVDRAQNELDHLFPFLLPDGHSVLLTIVSTGGANTGTENRIDVLDLNTGTRTLVIANAAQGEYVDTGHLVYAVSNSLRAVTFNLHTLAVSGSAVPVVEQLMMFGTGAAEFAVSRQGSLVMMNGTPDSYAEPRTLVWLDRQGREEPVQAPTRTYTVPRISPDGLRAALDIRDRDNDIWIWDFRRQTLTPLTFSTTLDMNPVWTPDGKRVVWAAVGGTGTPNIFWQAADGTGAPERITRSGNPQFPSAVTRDGTRLLLFESGAGTLQMDVRMVPLLTAPNTGTTSTSTPLVSTKANETAGEVSPDGRWIAYQSDKSGTAQIYVSPFPNTDGGLWQISDTGGSRPLWARNGRELFYLDGKGLLTSVAMDSGGPTPNPGNPRRVLDKSYVLGTSTRGFDLRSYDVSPDGERFLMIKSAPPSERPAAPPLSLTVVLNWAEELKARVRQKP